MMRRPSLSELISENERLRKTIEMLVFKEKMGVEELKRMCREKGEIVEP